uniref:Uncharacterized protein n=1 Tax=Lepeophtheirus salmonis TaxID=72036 RepID=A0A0K2SXK3_LEPSM
MMSCSFLFTDVGEFCSIATFKPSSCSQ